MKIYASKNNDRTTFKNLEGKDLWIKVMNYARPSFYTWIKIIKIRRFAYSDNVDDFLITCYKVEQTGYGYFIGIPLSYFNLPREEGIQEVLFDETFTFTNDEIRIVQPGDCMTTAELIDVIEIENARWLGIDE